MGAKSSRSTPASPPTGASASSAATPSRASIVYYDDIAAATDGHTRMIAPAGAGAAAATGNGNGSNGMNDGMLVRHNRSSSTVTMMSSTTIASLARDAEMKMDWSESSLPLDNEALAQLAMSYANRRMWTVLTSLLLVRRVKISALTHCLIRACVAIPREMSLCERLVQLGADVNMARGLPEEPRDCPSVVHAIAIAGAIDMLPWVVSRGGNLSLPMETNWNEIDPIWGPSPPVILAHMHNHTELVIALILHGASIDPLLRLHKHYGGNDYNTIRVSSSSSPVDARVTQLRTIIHRVSSTASHMTHVMQSLFNYCASRPSVLGDEVPTILAAPCMISYQWRPRLPLLAMNVDLLNVAMRHGAIWDDGIDGCSRCVWYRGGNSRQYMTNLVTTCAASLLIPSDGITYNSNGNGMPLLDTFPIRTPYMQEVKHVITHCQTLCDARRTYLLSHVTAGDLCHIITDHNVIGMIAEYLHLPRFITECKRCGRCFDRIKSQSYGATQIGNADQFW